MKLILSSLEIIPKLLIYLNNLSYIKKKLLIGKKFKNKQILIENWQYCKFRKLEIFVIWKNYVAFQMNKIVYASLSQFEKNGLFDITNEIIFLIN